MRRLSAMTALAPPGPRSLATVVNRWARSISRSFITGKIRVGCAQEQDCLNCCFQVIITNSPPTGCRKGVAIIGFHGGLSTQLPRGISFMAEHLSMAEEVIKLIKKLKKYDWQIVIK